MTRFISFLTLTLSFSLAHADFYLTPADFGLVTNAHGRIDHRYIPSNLLIGNFNNDHYPDIARFSGNKLEIFIFQGKGYTSEPQGVREFDRQIASLRHDDFVWDNIDNLIVTFIDGGADTLFQRGGCLDLVGYPASKRSDVPRRVSEADFEIVWESEPRPYGMDCCAVGDLDNDGINELVTWWKESLYGDSAWILIYKSVGDDEYELFMEEPFYTAELPYPALTSLLIDDLDKNGQKELIFTLGYAHFWEFSEPGVYWPWRSSFCFYGGVSDIQISDVDQDGQLELTSVSKYSGSPIPCAYEVEEFSHKTSWPTYIYAFNAVSCLFQEWIDYQLDVGDFDNDGAVDIVSGWFGMWPWYDPFDIQYFRYDSTQAFNFSQEWLYTGLPVVCSTPVIADFDGDGDNELFAGGGSPYSGSTFLWEATGSGTGYVSWLDTTSMSSFIVHRSSFGVVDSSPSVISIGASIYTEQMFLFGQHDTGFGYLWRSDSLLNVAYYDPIFSDIDQDDKMNILIVDIENNTVVDWEQTSAGLWEKPIPSIPQEFLLHPNYPNPFNNMTIIRFQLPVAGFIRLDIFDINGRNVGAVREPPLQGHWYSAGTHQITFDGSNLSSGIYIYRLQAGDLTASGKMILMK